MSTLETIHTAWARLDAALRARRPVEVSYHGRRRVICPHALGWMNDRPLVLGYQIGGETSTGSLHPDPCKRWRCMYVDEIDGLVEAHPACEWASADNYNSRQPFAVIDEVAIAVT